MNFDKSLYSETSQLISTNFNEMISNVMNQLVPL